MLKIVALVLVGVALGVFGGETTIRRSYGTRNVYLNQTSWGYFRRVKGETQDKNVSSIWMQDDLNKRLRVDVGTRGNKDFEAEFYFFKTETYEVVNDGKGGVTCMHVPDFNYSMEVDTYGTPNFGFIGRHVLEEYNNVKADVYAGQAVDGVGPMNCVFYCDAETCKKYLGLVVIGVANQFSYLEYWYGNNVTTDQPPAHWFNLPEECKKPHTEYYFEKRNKDGSLKPKPAAKGADDYCSKDRGHDMSAVLYRSLCCGLEKEATGH